MDWVPIWNKTLYSHKVQSLPGETFKTWLNLLLLANQLNANGTLPPIEDMALALRVKHETMKRFIAELDSAGLIDRESDGGNGREELAIHDWEQWQIKPPTSTDRVRRFRAKSKKGNAGNACNVSSVSSNRGNAGNDETPEKRREEKKEEGEKTPPQKLRSTDTEADRQAIEIATQRWGASNGDSIVMDLLRFYDPPLVIEAMNRHWDKKKKNINAALLRNTCLGMSNDGWTPTANLNGHHKPEPAPKFVTAEPGWDKPQPRKATP